MQVLVSMSTWIFKYIIAGQHNARSLIIAHRLYNI